MTRTTLTAAMVALPSLRDPLFQVEQLALAYAGCRGQPPAAVLTNVSVMVERDGALVLLGPD